LICGLVKFIEYPLYVQIRWFKFLGVAYFNIFQLAQVPYL
jgi:hypothetical protein